MDSLNAENQFYHSKKYIEATVAYLVVIGTSRSGAGSRGVSLAHGAREPGGA